MTNDELINELKRPHFDGRASVINAMPLAVQIALVMWFAGRTLAPLEKQVLYDWFAWPGLAPQVDADTKLRTEIRDAFEP